MKALSNKNHKCIRCDKVVKTMKEPYAQNFKGAVDVLLYPHYGSEHTTGLDNLNRHNRNLTVNPFWSVLCDKCFTICKNR